MSRISKPPSMRPWLEIQKAHDMLSVLALDPELRRKVIDCDKVDLMIASLDVLCWVLHHDHNQTFAVNLRDVEGLLADAGFKLEEVQ